MKHMHIEKKIKKHEEKGESSISILLNSEHIETRNIRGVGLNRFAVGVPDEHLPKSLTGRFLTFKS